MQFRAGTLYIALFVLIIAGAFAVVTTAEAPSPAIDASDADHRAGVDDTFTVGDRTYTVLDVGTTEVGGDDGHGGGGETHEVYAGTIAWTDASATLSQTWDDGDTVEIDGTTYVVVVPESDDGAPESFTLREEFDDDVETVDRDGETYVVVEGDDGEERLVHADDYEEIDSRTYEEGDTLRYQPDEDTGTVTATVTSITASSATIEWEGAETTEIDVQQGQTVSLGSSGEEYVAYFPSGNEVYFSSDVDGWERQQADLEYHHQRVDGLWGIAILAALVVLLLAGLAFMPVRG